MTPPHMTPTLWTFGKTMTANQMNHHQDSKSSTNVQKEKKGRKPIDGIMDRVIASRNPRTPVRETGRPAQPRLYK